MEFNERLDICRKAIRNEHTDYIPVLSNFYTGMTIDSEYTLQEALYDWETMFKVFCEHHERYGFDYYADRAYRNPFAFVDTLGGNLYKVDEPTQTLCIINDAVFMQDDEYDELLKEGYFPFVWSKIMNRRCTLSHGDDMPERWKKTFEEFNKLQDFNAKTQQKFLDDYKIPNWFKSTIFPFVESLMMGFRGIKGFSIDLRRHYDKVKSACEMAFDDFHKWTEYSFQDKTNDIAVADFMISMLTHSLLNEKQFNDLWWKYVGPDIERAAKENMTVYCFVEASMLRFADHFRDVPNGTIAIFSENDDIFEVREKLPNCAVVGGIPCNLLKNGTKEENIDHVKKVIDALGDHGLTLSQDKMVSFAQDFDRDNMLAVMEYVRGL